MFKCDEYLCYPEHCPEYDSVMTDDEFYSLQDHVRGLLEDVYQTGSLDNLAYHLDEVASAVGLRIPEMRMRLKTKRSLFKEIFRKEAVA